MTLLGIDIGGTKTGACVGNRDGELLARHRIHTKAQDGPERGLEQTLALVHQVLENAGTPIDAIEAVGLASPGPVSVATGTMLEPPNMQGWVDVPVVRYFEEKLGKPVFMNNDANACVLAESMFGSCKGIDNLVYMTMSTGMGAGIMVNGELLQGASDMGGEIGHHCLDIHGPPCPCGLTGCFEMYCGGKNVADRLRKQIVEGEIKTDILDEAGGDPAAIDFRAFVAAVEMKDDFALSAWDEYVERLAQGIGNIIMILNPSAIVLGTIAIHTGDLLLKPLLRNLDRYTWPYSRRPCRIVPSALGDRIGDLSALALAIRGVQAH